MEVSDLKNRFTYHPHSTGQAVVYETIRSHAMLLALHLNDNCPESREKSLAVMHLEDCVMWANAAIARHGLPSTAVVDDGG